MSVSLIAVFIPILLMGGIVGRLFREFAVTLSVAIAGLAGGVADHHADDVRAACCAAHGERSDGRLYRCERAGVRGRLRRGYEPHASAGRCATRALMLVLTLRHGAA